MNAPHRVKTYFDVLNRKKEARINNEDQFLSEQVYLEFVKKTVIACADVVFTIPGDRAIYLAKRSALPMRGIWNFGGRIFFNDKTPEESVSRCILKETGFKIDPDRLHFLRVNYYSWDIVKQGSFPGKNLSIVYRCDVSSEEIEKMSQGLIESEYDKAFGIQRFDYERLIHEDVHEAMLDLFNQVFI